MVDFFEGMEHPVGNAATLNSTLDGAISRFISQGEIKGKLNQITIINGLGKLPVAMVVVVGLGKHQELSLNKIRVAVADTCRL